ncbi:MAG: ice-binding family protein [Nitrosarchaeum sp.]
MISLNIKHLLVLSVIIFSSAGIIQNNAFADGTSNFGILASTYTNTASGTVITGDVGYTTGPMIEATVSGIIRNGDSVYSQAGIAQNAMTSSANSQACTSNLGTTVDLSLVNGGKYTPGVYCTTGAASIGTAGITLSGNGNYIFKIGGALTTVANSNVKLTNGAQASNITWVPTGATTLGANSNFAGIILDAAGVTIGNGVSIIGQVLAFGGTVTTGPSVKITVPSIPSTPVTSIPAKTISDKIITPTSNEGTNIPVWIKNTMGWYIDGSISEHEMILAIQFLVNQGIIKLN